MGKLLSLIIALAGVCASAIAEKGYDTSLPYQKGNFEPNWESLGANYKVPEWFRDAKFGIWAHWGIQCSSGFGDWCGLYLYNPQIEKPSEWYSSSGKRISKMHLEKYGHPSQFGMKDYIPLFTASKWDPEKLIELYKRAGAKYFVAMANHHDNFDNWNSKYQPWNSVNMGPKRDLIGEWAKVTRKNGLKFGVTVHAARTWDWLAPTFSADKEGKYKGVKYDTFLTKADGKGKWWDGYDPADLYTKPHKVGDPCSQEYLDKFYLRTLDLIDNYKPDLVYFDDGKTPLENVGLKIIADYYNSAEKWHNGKADVVVNSKNNSLKTAKALVEDVERGGKNSIYPTPWQTDTCIGGWHYNDAWYKKGYKTPEMVVKILIDVVSKNGNLLLNIPIKADGSIDDKELAFLDGMSKWIAVNGEGIYSTRPWIKFGEGETNANVKAFQDSKVIKYKQSDIRFTSKGDTLFAFVMTTPTEDLTIKSVTPDVKNVKSVKLLGSDENIEWTQSKDGLRIKKSLSYPSEYASCYKID